jgi:hypothetical protein
VSFDYTAPAELFLSKQAKDSRIKYRRFATAAEAPRYAIEELGSSATSSMHRRFGASVCASGTALPIKTQNFRDRHPTFKKGLKGKRSI